VPGYNAIEYDKNNKKKNNITALKRMKRMIKKNKRTDLKMYSWSIQCKLKGKLF